MITKEDAENLMGESTSDLVDMICSASELVDNLNKKIEELENRSCDNCKHFDKRCKHFGCGDIGGCGIYYEIKEYKIETI